jgi:hypothetical protein
LHLAGLALRATISRPQRQQVTSKRVAIVRPYNDADARRQPKLDPEIGPHFVWHPVQNAPGQNGMCPLISSSVKFRLVRLIGVHAPSFANPKRSAAARTTFCHVPDTLAQAFASSAYGASLARTGWLANAINAHWIRWARIIWQARP